MNENKISIINAISVVMMLVGFVLFSLDPKVEERKTWEIIAVCMYSLTAFIFLLVSVFYLFRDKERDEEIYIGRGVTILLCSLISLIAGISAIRAIIPGL